MRSWSQASENQSVSFIIQSPLYGNFNLNFFHEPRPVYSAGQIPSPCHISIDLVTCPTLIIYLTLAFSLISTNSNISSTTIDKLTFIPVTPVILYLTHHDHSIRSQASSLFQPSSYLSLHF